MPVTRNDPLSPSVSPAKSSASVDAEAAGPAGQHLPKLDEGSALFLDFDGTLVDLAAQPEAVVIPDGLTALLARLSDLCGGALAVVSGRKLGDLDFFLSPLRLPLAAEHGAQRRLPGSQTAINMAEPDLRAVIDNVTAFAERHAGLRTEVKSAAVALHYRHAPELESQCLAMMTEAAGQTAGVELLYGKFVFEIKPSGISKGTAITDFMKQPPFRGRVPVFAGDDVTDEAGFTAVQAMGGVGIKVGGGPTLAHARCDSTAAMRHWLASAAGLGHSEKK
jgi:trehalose 6-phosphate phosphatase